MRILLILLAVIIVVWILRYLSKASPQAARIMTRNILIAVAVLLFLFLLATGRMHWLFALVAAAIPFLRRAAVWLRYLPWVQQLYRNRQGGQGYASSRGKTSQVNSEFLTMHLDQESGEIDGEVLKGSFKGKNLAQLNLDDLMLLYAEISADPDSRSLLQAYLDRIHPAWRQRQQADSAAQGSNAGSHGKQTVSTSEAYEILGLDNKATRKDVIAAHRRLMQRLHPDHGGSNYLAIKINLAKDHLLQVLTQ